MCYYSLRVEFGLRYAYFGNTSTALMDKLSFYVDRSIELGGEVSECTMLYAVYIHDSLYHMLYFTGSTYTCFNRVISHYNLHACRWLITF